MKIQQFLEHHGIVRNPFAEEDAQTDPVFKDYCIASTYHPSWDKVYGDPREPATSVVFGERGSGKTAMRLQIARHLREYNQQNPRQRVFIVHYDDFNPFLDRFRDTLSSRRRRPDKVLAEWKLWDHMDAILSLAVTGIVDRILQIKQPSPWIDAELDPRDITDLDRNQARDLLLLAACYDQSTAESFKSRWNHLRRRLGFRTWAASRSFALGCTVSVAVIVLVATLVAKGASEWLDPLWFWLAIAAAAWIPWLWRAGRRWLLARRILHYMRIGVRETKPLRQVLMRFTAAEISSQPMPNKDSTDARYEMLLKLQGLLKTFGYTGVIVLVDRVDEPHLINGAAELMKALLWPMLDNKFLKHPGLGIKMMLPIELTRFIEREERDFYQRARLDKQNMIPRFEWTAEGLYDVASARLQACAARDHSPSLQAFLDPSISSQRLMEALRSLRTPRHLFRFIYRLLVNHCNAHTDEKPEWNISPELFESTLAVYLRDQDAFDRGVGAG